MADDVVIERLAPADSERARAIRLRALRGAPDAFWTTLAEEEQRPRSCGGSAWRLRTPRRLSRTGAASMSG